MHIHTCHNRLVVCLLAILGCAMQCVDALDVHPVAHNEACETILATHLILHQPLALMTRDAVNLVVCHHQRTCLTLADSLLIWWKEHLVQGALRDVGWGVVSTIHRL